MLLHTLLDKLHSYLWSKGLREIPVMLTSPWVVSFVTCNTTLYCAITFLKSADNIVPAIQMLALGVVGEENINTAPQYMCYPPNYS